MKKGNAMENEKFKKYSLEILAECTRDQLVTLNSLVVNSLRASREIANANARNTLEFGQKVTWVKGGIRYVGEILKINRTTANVMEITPTRGRRWKVALSACKAA